VNNSIYVLGTMHTESRRYKAKHVYDYMCGVKPDILLMEIPLEWEKGIPEFLHHYANEHKGTEGIAELKYLKSHELIIRPYDIKGRNTHYAKKDYFNKEQAFEKALANFLKSENLSPEGLALKSILEKAQEFLDNKSNNTQEKINSFEYNIAVDLARKVVFDATLAICKFCSELQALQTDWLEHEHWEDKRERAMVKNILNYNRGYEGKKILIFCGFWHLSFLRRELAKHQEKEGFTLK